MRVAVTTATARASPAASRVSFTRARYEWPPGLGVTKRCHHGVESSALAGLARRCHLAACLPPRSRGRLSASRYTDQHPAAKLAIA
jgi:hypothetical protein